MVITPPPSSPPTFSLWKKSSKQWIPKDICSNNVKEYTKETKGGGKVVKHTGWQICMYVFWNKNKSVLTWGHFNGYQMSQ